MSKHKPVHADMTQFPVRNNILQVGNKPITDLARQVGQTPFYVYDRTLITQKVELLRQNLPAKIHLHYAIKANPMPALVEHLGTLVDGLDVASGNELKTALNSGMQPENISFAGPGKSDSELEAAILSGVIIIIESEGEFNRIASLAKKHNEKPKVLIRVNPEFELRNSGMKMGGGPSPFGVDAEKVPALLQKIEHSNILFHGFHIYCGSQNLHPESIKKAHTNTFELARELSQQTSQKISMLNIGGGFGIPYFPGEQTLDVESVGHNLNSLLSDYSEFSETEIIIELGRYLVGEAGLYVCEIIDRKESRGETFLVANGGMHHHLALSGNFGQILRKNYPVCIGNKMSSDKTEVVSVVGPLCTPLDILAKKMELPQANIGDLFVVFQSGAYGLSASPQSFLSHPPAAEILV